MGSWKIISITIVGVLGCSALIGWTAWRFLRNSENPRIVRHRLYRAAAIYGVGALLGFEQVLTGQAPLWSLLLLPIPIYFIWVYVQAGNKITTAPERK